METGKFELDALLMTLAKLPTLSREKYLEQLADYYPPRQRIAAALAGVTDRPWMLDLPTTREEAEQYVQDHPRLTQLIDTPPAPELSATVDRLWGMLLRAKIERRFGI